MKTWRIHLGWLLVTLLAVGVTARVGSLQAPALPQAPAPVRPVTAASSQSEAAVPIPVVAEVAPIPATATTEPIPYEDQIRAQLQSAKYVEETSKILRGILDPALQRKLLREAACGKDLRLSYAALEVLRHMRGREVAEILQACLEVNRDDGPGAYAARLLGNIGDTLSYAPLTRALAATDENTRVSSAESLRKLGFPQAAQDMTALYTQQFESPDGSLRKRAVENLVSLALESSIAVFTRALKDSNGDVRLEALDAFSTLGRKEFLPLLEPLLQDPRPEVADRAKGTVQAIQGDP